jgi:hypothetical protein
LAVVVAAVAAAAVLLVVAAVVEPLVVPPQALLRQALLRLALVAAAVDRPVAVAAAVGAVAAQRSSTPAPLPVVRWRSAVRLMPQRLLRAAALLPAVPAAAQHSLRRSR